VSTYLLTLHGDYKLGRRVSLRFPGVDAQKNPAFALVFVLFRQKSRRASATAPRLAPIQIPTAVERATKSR
jgi:hypothetical protein